MAIPPIPPSPITASSISSAGGSLSNGIYNNTPANTARLRLGIQKAKNGSAREKFICIGDSTTAIGAVAGGPFVTVLSWPKMLADKLTQLGYPARTSSAFGNLGFDTASLPSVDPRRSLGAGWVVPTTNIPYGPGGVMLYNGTTTNPYSITFTEQYDTVDVYYMRHLGNGSFNIDLDGGTATTVNSGTGSDAMGKVTVTGSLGTHVLNITRVSGDVYIIGADAYNSTSPDISIMNLGWANAKISDLVRAAKAWEPLNAYQAFDAIGYSVEVGINDWNNGTALSSFEASDRLLISTLLADPASVFSIGQQETGGVVGGTTQQLYRNILYKVALDTGCPYVALNERFGPYSGSSTWLAGSQWMRDPSHMTDNGNGDISDVMARVLTLRN